ncbi:hypothetical protein TUMEXPCC7403_02435 [Tumidithrix helvetica PCC 7403]|uniref:hypothetical protein n=1 Tax=Tumidithrix helvetica TaxID=3457545 RepID=UPI003CA45846
MKGRPELRAYFAKGLATYPDLKFELLQVLLSVESLVVYYRSINDLFAAEQMFVNSEGLVAKVVAHYNI